MKYRYKISVNTCNTNNFGLYIPRNNKVSETKGFCLTANGYPSVNGHTKRTYILEVE